MQKNNTIASNKTINTTFNLKATNIYHHPYPTSYKLLDDLSKIVSLYTIICIKQNMLIELCAKNYATTNGLVNTINGIFKTSTSYHNKTIIWISFSNPKIKIVAKEKSIHLYTNNVYSTRLNTN